MSTRTTTEEIARRRTFAIISHPDAGKTTLTEKLLLYGGALHLAGSVRARRNMRATASDWMELEKERGISISSTLMQFEYGDACVNLLDTPGHKDFSEDTYRVLTAVDNVVMVLDAAKGVEERTRKLFEICSLRKIPIFTFVNKMDRPARSSIDLLDEIEKVLGIHAVPVTWPLGSGADFKGVYDRLTHQVYLFEPTKHGQHRAPFQVSNIHDPAFRERLGDNYADWMESVEMISMAGEQFDQARVKAGQITPVFFGSAMNNFGVQHLLDYFIRYGEPPAPRQTGLRQVCPEDPDFSGFVFKVQANMNPKHRDNLAFVRVCSGIFEKDMSVIDPRDPARKLRLAYPQRLFGQERETVERAYPGDIVGLVSHGNFHIGDTLSATPGLRFHEIPRFAPEVFGYLRNPNPSRFKQFRDGLGQLLAEGVIQRFRLPEDISDAPLLGAVGPLQFDVVRYRLENEYGAVARLDTAPYTLIRWLEPGTTRAAAELLTLGVGVTIVADADEELALLFPNEWALRFVEERNPALVMHRVSPHR
ncbi:MAG: peptide chain release factor 3 [bacterium]